jgi:uroporphyrinogen-III synthase
MHVLITRPRRDAEVLAKQLQALGHTTLIEPLIDVAFAAGPRLAMNRVQALLLTSANGARAAARRIAERDMHVLAVGPATAAEATALGFTRITKSTGEGVDALAKTVRETLKPPDGTLVHVTGTATAGDLKSALAPAGFTVRS